MKWVLAAGVLILSAGAAAATEPAKPTEPPERYQIQRGDTLYDLAGKYLNRLGDYRRVQRANRVANPRRLPLGGELQIAPELLRTEPIAAQLVAFRGAITVSQGAAELPVARGMPIREGHALATGPNAFLTVELPDGSRVTLPSNSRLRVQRLRRVVMTGALQRDFAIDAGRSNAVVTPARNPRDRFLLQTPLTVSAVRGTEFRTNFDPERGQATLEVIEGTVTNVRSADASEQPVTAGFGVQTTPQGAGAPAPLLPEPKPVRGALLQDEPELSFRLEPLDGAGRYRAQIAMDAGFVDIVAETEAPSPQLRFASIPNGTYFARFTALAADGLEGRPSTFAFERRLNSLSLEEPRALAGAKRRYLFKWTTAGEGTASYRFVLTPSRAGAAPVIDQSGLTSGEFVVTDLPPGAYEWRVLVVRFEDGKAAEKWSAPQRFEVAR
ncbi:FecR domain-containing protein [Phenylobacterium sp. VNQ135]|uniref:FecR domain-containing protein n=1 Tax=Phenylobacterium sp. VNQ135 TaxID=3400922 RepID=UPI003C0438C4